MFSLHKKPKRYYHQSHKTRCWESSSKPLKLVNANAFEIPIVKKVHLSSCVYGEKQTRGHIGCAQPARTRLVKRMIHWRRSRILSAKSATRCISQSTTFILLFSAAPSGESARAHRGAARKNLSVA